MTNLSDTLAALSARIDDAATSRQQEDLIMILASDLVEAYRTGQLVPVPSVERVARLIAEELGDNYDDAPADKREWTKTHGQFRGVFRDVNQPFRCDYDAAATAVIAAMKEGRE